MPTNVPLKASLGTFGKWLLTDWNICELLAPSVLVTFPTSSVCPFPDLGEAADLKLISTHVDDVYALMYLACVLLRKVLTTRQGNCFFGAHSFNIDSAYM